MYKKKNVVYRFLTVYGNLPLKMFVKVLLNCTISERKCLLPTLRLNAVFLYLRVPTTALNGQCQKIGIVREIQVYTTGRLSNT